MRMSEIGLQQAEVETLQQLVEHLLLLLLLQKQLLEQLEKTG